MRLVDPGPAEYSLPRDGHYCLNHSPTFIDGIRLSTSTATRRRSHKAIEVMCNHVTTVRFHAFGGLIIQAYKGMGHIGSSAGRRFRRERVFCGSTPVTERRPARFFIPPDRSDGLGEQPFGRQPDHMDSYRQFAPSEFLTYRDVSIIGTIVVLLVL